MTPKAFCVLYELHPCASVLLVNLLETTHNIDELWTKIHIKMEISPSRESVEKLRTDYFAQYSNS